MDYSRIKWTREWKSSKKYMVNTGNGLKRQTVYME
jgi:hypothetical protein